MKNYPSLKIILIVCCAVFAASVYPQKKNSEVKKDSAPPIKKFELSKFEAVVFKELNEARSSPKIYVAHLEQMRKAMRGTIIKISKQADVQTIEGAAAVDEAIADLNRVGGLSDFTISEGLTAVARAQLADLQGNSKLGHFGKDGSDLKTRMARFGVASGKSGENICHRGLTARDVVAIFLVDDGIKTRSHRRAVLSRSFKRIGVACGAGKNAESLCVVVFADEFRDKTSGTAVVEF